MARKRHVVDTSTAGGSTIVTKTIPTLSARAFALPTSIE
jgi:hypothetical protein